MEGKGGIATHILWRIKDEEKVGVRFSGRYKLRSSRGDLSDKALWDIYNMLTNIESSFRSLKHELSLRPLYHRIDKRIEAHIFITLLAYHLLCVIQRRLREKGIRHLWKTIRTNLSSLVYVTTTMLNNKGQTIYIRQISEPEPFQIEIFKALNLPLKSYKPVIRII